MSLGPCGNLLFELPELIKQPSDFSTQRTPHETISRSIREFSEASDELKELIKINGNDVIVSSREDFSTEIVNQEDKVENEINKKSNDGSILTEDEIKRINANTKMNNSKQINQDNNTVDDEPNNVKRENSMEIEKSKNKQLNIHNNKLKSGNEIVKQYSKSPKKNINEKINRNEVDEKKGAGTTPKVIEELRENIVIPKVEDETYDIDIGDHISIITQDDEDEKITPKNEAIPVNFNNSNEKILKFNTLDTFNLNRKKSQTSNMKSPESFRIGHTSSLYKKSSNLGVGKSELTTPNNIFKQISRHNRELGLSSRMQLKTLNQVNSPKVIKKMLIESVNNGREKAPQRKHIQQISKYDVRTNRKK